MPRQNDRITTPSKNSAPKAQDLPLCARCPDDFIRTMVDPDIQIPNIIVSQSIQEATMSRDDIIDASANDDDDESSHISSRFSMSKKDKESQKSQEFKEELDITVDAATVSVSKAVAAAHDDCQITSAQSIQKRFEKLISDFENYCAAMKKDISEIESSIKKERIRLNTVLFSFCSVTDNINPSEFDDYFQELDDHVEMLASKLDDVSDKLHGFSSDMHDAVAYLTRFPHAAPLQEKLQDYLRDIPAYLDKITSLNESLVDIGASIINVNLSLDSPIVPTQSLSLVEAKQTITRCVRDFCTLGQRFQLHSSQLADAANLSDFERWRIEYEKVLSERHGHSLEERTEVLNGFLKACRIMYAQLLLMEKELNKDLIQYSLIFVETRQLRQRLSESYAQIPSCHFAVFLKFLEVDSVEREKNYANLVTELELLKYKINVINETQLQTKKALQALVLLSENNHFSLFAASRQILQSDVKLERVDDGIQVGASEGGLRLS